VFFRRGPSEDKGREGQPAGPATAEEGALDTLGQVIRTLASVDDDEPEQRVSLEAWANHALTQTSPPGRADRLPAGRRDWAGLRGFVVTVIQLRARASKKNVVDLREALGTVTRSLFRAVAEDRASDKAARSELERLKLAAEERPPEEIKACALQAVKTITAVLEERERRLTARAAELAEKAKLLEGRLERAELAQITDALTNLINRRGFDHEAARALEAQSVFGERSVLILLDIDHFKKLNDAHGHVVGDQVLQAVARSLALSFPRRGDCVARYGGEEFAIILRNSGLEDGARLARRCLQQIRTLDVWNGDRAVFVTASAGVAALGEDDDVKAWIQEADAALYEAKRQGRDRALAAGIDVPRRAARLASAAE
jgi:diguanylate cyclase (GGDEF)-like protein